MPALTFISQSSRSADNIAFSPERLINAYAEMGPQNAKGQLLIRSVLGQTTFASLGVSVIRAVGVVNGVMYAVGSGNLYSVSSSGTVAILGLVQDDPVTTIDGNGTSVTIAAGGVYYVWDGSTLSSPVGGAFSSEGTVTYIDQRTIISEKDGDRFEWTDLADPESRQVLNVATNESRNDNTLRVLADRRELWFFGEESTEIWYNTGQAGADAFERINGGALDTGCLGALLSVKMDNGIFFIGDDRVAYITQGMQLMQVSSPPVNQAIEASTPTHCFYYEDRGHRFCVIRFDDRPAWVYDMTTQLWHERSTDVTHEAWEVVTTVKAFGKWYAATNVGDIYEMTRGNADVNYPLKRTAISRNLYMQGNQFSVSEFELLCRVGESGKTTIEQVPLTDMFGENITDMFGAVIYVEEDVETDPKVAMRISKDSGTTFGSEILRSLGNVGDREQRVIWRALGSYRNFCIELSFTDADNLTFYSEANVGVM